MSERCPFFLGLRGEKGFCSLVVYRNISPDTSCIPADQYSYEQLHMPIYKEDLPAITTEGPLRKDVFGDSDLREVLITFNRCPVVNPVFPDLGRNLVK